MSLPKSTKNNIIAALITGGGKPVEIVYKITKNMPHQMDITYGSLKMFCAKNHHIPNISATFNPLAASKCKSPELTKLCLISSGGFMVSFPKTIPPKISI